VCGLHVLGQQQDAARRMRRLDLGGRAGALIGVRRRRPDVEHDDVRLLFGDQVGQALRVPVRADDVVTGVPEQTGESLAEQDLVLDQPRGVRRPRLGGVRLRRRRLERPGLQHRRARHSCGRNRGRRNVRAGRERPARLGAGARLQQPRHRRADRRRRRLGDPERAAPRCGDHESRGSRSTTEDTAVK
jgi:hypothetical protein